MAATEPDGFGDFIAEEEEFNSLPSITPKGRILGSRHDESFSHQVRSSWNALTSVSKTILSPPAAERSTRPDNIDVSTQQKTLGDYFPTENQSLTTYTDGECMEIARYLREDNKTAWSSIPRIYIVLRLIGLLHTIESFVNGGFNDLWFPFSHSSLPNTLTALDKERFLETQSRVLSKALELESGGLKRHAHFNREDAFPFQSRGTLGQGAYATVDRIYSPISGKEYARKRFRRTKVGPKKSEVQSFKTELQVLKRIQHIHCVELVASYTDSKYFGLIMTPVADCNLNEFYELASKSEEDRATLRTFFGCLSTALCYLHENKIRHRDIKPQNVLVRKSTVYLTDFGISLDWGDLTRGTTTADSAKTLMYCAPEVAYYEKRNSSSDIYSLGAIFVEMLTLLKGKVIQDLRQFISQNGDGVHYFRNTKWAMAWVERLTEFGNMTDNQIAAWIKSTLQHEPAARISASELCDLIAVPSGKDQAQFIGSCCFGDLDTSTDPGSDGVWEEEENHSNTFSREDSRIMEKPARKDLPNTTNKNGYDVKIENIYGRERKDRLSKLDSFNSMKETSIESLRKLVLMRDSDGRPWRCGIFFLERYSHSVQGYSPTSQQLNWSEPEKLLTSIKNIHLSMDELRENDNMAYYLFQKAEVQDLPILLEAWLYAGFDIYEPEFSNCFLGSCSCLLILGPRWTHQMDIVPLFKLLVDYGIITPMSYLKDMTVMELVSAEESGETFEYLFNREVDPNKGPVINSPLEKAVANKNLFVSRALINKGAYVDRAALFSIPPLVTACKIGDLDMVDLLCSHGANPDIRSSVGGINMTPLIAASSHGQSRIVRHLMQHYFSKIDLDVQIRDTGYTALAVAAFAGHDELVNLLLWYGANPNTKVHYPPTKDGYPNLKAALIKNSVSPFHEACKNGRLEQVKSFLTCKSDVNLKLENGETPLYHAVKNSQTEIVRLLLSHGATFEESIRSTPTPTPVIIFDKQLRLVDANGADAKEARYRDYLLLTRESIKPEILDLLKIWKFNTVHQMEID